MHDNSNLYMASMIMLQAYSHADSLLCHSKCMISTSDCCFFIKCLSCLHKNHKVGCQFSINHRSTAHELKYKQEYTKLLMLVCSKVPLTWCQETDTVLMAWFWGHTYIFYYLHFLLWSCQVARIILIEFIAFHKLWKYIPRCYQIR